MKDPNKLFMWSGNGIPNNAPPLENSVTEQLREAARQREMLRQEMLYQETKRAETPASEQQKSRII